MNVILSVLIFRFSFDINTFRQVSALIWQINNNTIVRKIKIKWRSNIVLHYV